MSAAECNLIGYKSADYKFWIVIISHNDDRTVRFGLREVFIFQKQEEECVKEECVNENDEDINVFLADLARVNNSRERASKLFQWLIYPIPAKSFFK